MSDDSAQPRRPHADRDSGSDPGQDGGHGPGRGAARVLAERVLDEPAMSAWAERLGASLRGGDVVLLRGPMGAGKTTLTRALARGLGVARAQRVSSPTYTICMVHPCRARDSTRDEASTGVAALIHVDLFRLGEDGPVGAAAFEALGLEHDELPGDDRVLVVEWSELWHDPPARQLIITLARTPDDRRAVVLEASGEGWERVAGELGDA